MQTDRIEYPVTSGYIQVVAEGHVLPAFWAHPDTGGTFPGLALAHDHWGLTPSIRRMVRRFAESGYYVIAPDVFNQQQPETEALARAYAADHADTALPFIAAAISALRTHNHCNHDIGVIGFGMGAGMGMQLAVQRADIKAAVLINGVVEQHKLLIAAATIPLLGIYSGSAADDESGSSVEMLRVQYESSGPHNVFLRYPTAGRDFFYQERPDYDPETVEPAWSAILDFLDDHLAAPSHPPDIRYKAY